jgi:hypothetical protein
MVRFSGAEPATTGRDAFRMPAHLAFCASAIFRRDAAEIIRFGWVVLPGVAATIPLKDSMPEIISSNFCSRN